MSTSGSSNWWSRISTSVGLARSSASAPVNFPPVSAPLPPVLSCGVKISGRVGGVVHVSCPCGFDMVAPDAGGAFHIAKTHQSQHDLGVADVDCAFCGDRMPVSVATELAPASEAVEAVRYICPTCAEPVPEVDPETLIDDLRSLRDELSEKSSHRAGRS